ncbi:hypothetical protein Nepgr_008590 [Nepenthes gracilis]|uniref:BZIP domain-containing protein n=1 Tax=Nepenthes gracilis TaxID=150966 RepID=A0AAD3XJI9_NEPGR|nr:hypothetical protein Nepgr_008590 [Nepenthes gracilis]
MSYKNDYSSFQKLVLHQGMENAKGSANVRNMIQTGKNSLLPPRSPFPSISPSYADYGPNPAIGSKAVSKPKDGNVCHQRTSSESVLLEEQPYWLDELLNEPETPVQRGHRRSSSDSFAYIDAANMSNIDYVPVAHPENKFNVMVPTSLWGSQNLDHYNDSQQGSVYTDLNSFGRLKNRAWDNPLNSMTHLGSVLPLRDNGISQSAGSSASQKEANLVGEKQDHGEYGPHDPESSAEKNDGSYAKTTLFENDTKRAKQQFAQRSRVRKLQYIAELERKVQALQAEGSEASSELEFLNQQNLILSMENKALKKRLESLSQEKLIKYLEHEVLEKEIARLRALYQQQQQPPQQNQHHQRQSSSSHRRVNSRDLDSQFANLSLKHKEAGSGADPVGGPVHI